MVPHSQSLALTSAASEVKSPCLNIHHGIFLQLQEADSLFCLKMLPLTLTITTQNKISQWSPKQTRQRGGRKSPTLFHCISFNSLKSVCCLRAGTTRVIHLSSVTGTGSKIKAGGPYGVFEHPLGARSGTLLGAKQVLGLCVVN